MIHKIMSAQYRRPTGLLGSWIGRKMSQQHVPENEWTVNLLGVKATDHVLEIGFGPGIAIEKLLPLVPQGKISGLDYSAAMVSAAKRRNREGVKGGQIDLRQGDAQMNLPFADKCFDKVFSIHCVYFWKQPEAALYEIYRVLKSDGKLFLTIYPNDDGSDPGTPDFTPYSGKELKSLVLSCGFSHAEVIVDDEKKSASNYAVVASK